MGIEDDCGGGGGKNPPPFHTGAGVKLLGAGSIKPSLAFLIASAVSSILFTKSSPEVLIFWGIAINSELINLIGSGSVLRFVTISLIDWGIKPNSLLVCRIKSAKVRLRFS